jgi:peptidoglycan/LPS O-acetylase OafA/YrhL
MTRPASEITYADYRARTQRPAFDGLRAIGFLFVITAHVPVVPFFGLLQGWAAVWIFLVMSGYLIAMLLMREEERGGRVAFGPFLVKRVARIVPAYYAAILIYFLACWLIEPAPGDYVSFTSRLPYFLAFLPEYADKVDFSIFTHSWTVGVEVKFYLLFPPLVFLFLRDANARVALTAIGAVVLTLQGSFIAHSYCALLCGALLAFALERPGGYAFIAALTRVPVIVPIIFVVALLALLAKIAVFPAIAFVATYWIAYAIVQEAKVARVLTWQPLVYLGQRSYGAYLMHFLVIRIGYLIFGDSTAVGGLMTAAFCLIVTIPVAEAMYRAIELPAIDYGRRLLQRRHS